MSKIVGVGELREGILERDPMDEGLQLRMLDANGKQQVLRLQEMLADYVGHPVRMTIAFTKALQAAEGFQAGLQAVTFDDLSKS
jgi:hypothetical protein